MFDEKAEKKVYINMNKTHSNKQSNTIHEDDQ